MTKALVRNRDPGATVASEPYDPKYPDMGIRWVVTLSSGRRMPWGGTMSNAWMRAHKALQSEAHPLEGMAAPRFMECKVQAFLSPAQKRQVQAAAEALGIATVEKK